MTFGSREGTPRMVDRDFQHFQSGKRISCWPNLSRVVGLIRSRGLPHAAVGQSAHALTAAA